METIDDIVREMRRFTDAAKDAEIKIGYYDWIREFADRINAAITAERMGWLNQRDERYIEGFNAGRKYR